MMMSDDWFSEYVYQVVADRKFISKKLVDVFDKADATVLPPWVRPLSLSLRHLQHTDDESLARRTRWARSREARAAAALAQHGAAHVPPLLPLLNLAPLSSSPS